MSRRQVVALLVAVALVAMGATTAANLGFAWYAATPPFSAPTATARPTALAVAVATVTTTTAASTPTALVTVGAQIAQQGAPTSTQGVPPGQVFRNRLSSQVAEYKQVTTTVGWVNESAKTGWLATRPELAAYIGWVQPLIQGDLNDWRSLHGVLLRAKPEALTVEQIRLEVVAMESDYNREAFIAQIYPQYR